MIITLTVTKLNGQTQGTLSRGFNTSWITNLRPTTEGNLSSAARFEYGEDEDSRQTFDVSQTYSATLSAIQSAEQEAGAELLANKDASGGYAGLTLFKINFKNALGTITSFFTNAATVARTYTFQDRNGTIADDTDLALKAPLASPTLTGTPVAPTAGVSINDTQIATTAFAQGRGKTPFGTSASAADTYVVVLAPAIATSAGSPLSGTRILLKCTNANTGAATLEVTGSTGAIAIVRRDGSTALSAADLPAGKYVPMFYDGTSWVCENVG